MRTAIGSRWLGGLMIVLMVVGATCKPKDIVPFLGAPQVRPVPDSANEVVGQAPSPFNLGGPYGNGVRAADHNMKTPEPRMPLTPTVNEKELVEYLNSLKFDMARDNGELALVACRPPSPAGCGARVYIQPEIGMRHRSFADVPPNGMVVARIINYSASATEGSYGIPPSTRAYWYVYPSNRGPRSRLFIRTPGPGDALKFISPDTAYSDCNHTPSGGPAVAKFRQCSTYRLSTIRGDAVREARSNPFVRTVSFGLSAAPVDEVPLVATELWVKCAQGCCVSGQAQ